MRSQSTKWKAWMYFSLSFSKISSFALQDIELTLWQEEVKRRFGSEVEHRSQAFGMNAFDICEIAGPFPSVAKVINTKMNDIFF